MENAVVMYTNMEREVKYLKEMQESIKHNVNKLKGKHLYLIYKHYIYGVSIKTIASNLGMSPSWGTTTHQRALKKMQKILDEEGK
jgi:DNA-directed RNA polymerase specialized sigma24 family protein